MFSTIDALFDFRGRFDRLSYFVGILGMVLAFAIVTFTCVLIEYHSEGMIETAAKGVMAAGACLLVWSNMAVTAKRLHDLKLNGFVQAPAWAINCLPFIFISEWASVLSWIVTIVVFGALAIIPSRVSE